MKSRAIILLCAVLCALLLAGCEPNVNNGGAGATSLIETTPRTPDHSTTPQTHTTTPHEDNREPAVGGTSSTAFTYDEEPLTLDSEPSVAVMASVLDINSLSDAKTGWGLGPARDSENRPTDALHAQSVYGDLGAIFIDGKTDNRIYLTFDEGYENGYSASILDTLKTKSVKATFFVTYDYCRSEPELVSRIIAEGHELANHSWSHPSFPDISLDEVKEEITKLHDYVKENFNYEMRLIRYPMGEFSERVLAVTKQLGYRSVFWSYAYMDWNVNNQPGTDEAFAKLTNASHPGAVYLLHAVSRTNAEILASAIDYWFENGFKPSLFE